MYKRRQPKKRPAEKNTLKNEEEKKTQIPKITMAEHGRSVIYVVTTVTAGIFLCNSNNNNINLNQRKPPGCKSHMERPTICWKFAQKKKEQHKEFANARAMAWPKMKENYFRFFFLPFSPHSSQRYYRLTKSVLSLSGKRRRK